MCIRDRSDTVRPTAQITCKNRQFKMPDIYSEELDNISCQGQNIAIDRCV